MYAITVVPAPSGADAGDESLVSEVSQHPEAYRYVVLNDATYRDILRTTRDREALSYRVVTKAEFCEGCADMMKGEGWTNAGAVHEMWRSIPVDCRESPPHQPLHFP